MLHLTHRTLDVFWQLRHRFFWFIISGQCATLSNLAAGVGSGLLTRLLLVSVFAVTDTRPLDFLAYALFTSVKASATSNVNCIKSFWLLLAASLVLRSLLYCSHPFTTATWSVQKNSPVPFSTSVVYSIQCSQHPLQIYAAHVLVVFFYNCRAGHVDQGFLFLTPSFYFTHGLCANSTTALSCHRTMHKLFSAVVQTWKAPRAALFNSFSVFSGAIFSLFHRIVPM
ncbi:hypothetical protein T08_12320, partial [Trichinella sp. T8]